MALEKVGLAVALRLAADVVENGGDCFVFAFDQSSYEYPPLRGKVTSVNFSEGESGTCVTIEGDATLPEPTEEELEAAERREEERRARGDRW